MDLGCGSQVRPDGARRGIWVRLGGDGADARYVQRTFVPPSCDLRLCEDGDVVMHERNVAWNRYVDRDPLAWRGTPAWRARQLSEVELTKAKWRRMRGIWLQYLKDHGFEGSEDTGEYEVLYEASRLMQDDMWQECVEEVRQEWRSKKRIWREVNFRAYLVIRWECDPRDSMGGDVDAACE